MGRVWGAAACASAASQGALAQEKLPQASSCLCLCLCRPCNPCCQRPWGTPGAQPPPAAAAPSLHAGCGWVAMVAPPQQPASSHWPASRPALLSAFGPTAAPLHWLALRWLAQQQQALRRLTLWRLALQLLAQRRPALRWPALRWPALGRLALRRLAQRELHLSRLPEALLHWSCWPGAPLHTTRTLRFGFLGTEIPEWRRRHMKGWGRR